MEEPLVSGAEVIEVGLTVWGAGEPMLRTFAVAGEAHVTFATVAGQGVALIGTELALLGGLKKCGEGDIHDVAETVFGIDEVVAGVKVTRMLKGESIAAGFAEDA